MDFDDTLSAIRREMEEQGIDLLLGFHDGVHFIEKPNAVMVLSGFKSLGHALVILPQRRRRHARCHAGLGCGKSGGTLSGHAHALEPIT